MKLYLGSALDFSYAHACSRLDSARLVPLCHKLCCTIVTEQESAKSNHAEWLRHSGREVAGSVRDHRRARGYVPNQWQGFSGVSRSQCDGRRGRRRQRVCCERRTPAEPEHCGTSRLAGSVARRRPGGNGSKHDGTGLAATRIPRQKNRDGDRPVRSTTVNRRRVGGSLSSDN